MTEHGGSETAQPVRRRRRAVGPAGAAPAVPVEDWPAVSEEPVPDDDERLLADVPPHHGGH